MFATDGCFHVIVALHAVLGFKCIYLQPVAGLQNCGDKSFWQGGGPHMKIYNTCAGTCQQEITVSLSVFVEFKRTETNHTIWSR